MTEYPQVRNIPNLREPLVNDYEVLRKAAEYYLMEGDLQGLLRISNYSQIVVAKAISKGNFTPKMISSLERDPEAAVRLYRQVRWRLNERARKMFRRLVAKAVVNLVIRGIRGNLEEKRRSETFYEVGMDFDIERTIDGLIERGKKLDELDYEDIVGLDKRRREYSAVVIIDSSGSMSGRKILSAATMAALISHKIGGGRYSVIGFNSEAFPIKHVNERKESIEVVEDILDLVPLGYTNIADGLVKALEESKNLVNPRFILLTDGEYNVGEDPRKVVSHIRGLHVVYVGRRASSRGARFCRDLAKLGNGRFHELKDPQEIPRLVRSILG